MKFRFKNLGPVNEAELELGEFTIIAGRNNTGKTYLVYTLYGFLQQLEKYVSTVLSSDYFRQHLSLFDAPSMDDILIGLTSGRKVSWYPDSELLCNEQVKVIKRAAAVYSKSGIAEVFNMPREVFSRASFEVDLVGGFREGESLVIQADTGDNLRLFYDGERIELSLQKRQRHREYSGRANFALEQSVRRLYGLFLEQCFPFRYSYPFILSSARLSIPLFYKELDYVRSQIVRSIQQGEDSIDKASRYASPVHDNIDSVRRVPNFSAVVEQFSERSTLSEIEKMLGGHFERDEEFRFVSKFGAEPIFDIPLHIASSSACEMLNLYCYLRNEDVLDEAGFLIIDEPESHLDTANQIQFARLLARLVNSGVHVLITTHSDYIIKEINNLIMLNSHFEDQDEIREEFGYRADDHLRPTFVRSYIAEEETLVPCAIDEFGMAMSVFDETINSINRAASKVATRIVLAAERE